MSERGLHIGIDGRELGRKPPGVGRYTLTLLRRWLADPTKPHRFTIFAAAQPSAELASLSDRVTWDITPAASAGTWWEQTVLASAAKRTGVDVLFAPAYTAPIRLACPLVLTIHDLSYFAHPDWFSWREGLRRRWITRQAARRAAAVVTISQFSGREIEQRLGIDHSRVHVVPHGGPSVVAIEPTDGPKREPMVLYVGSMFTRRRIPDLIKSFAIVGRTMPEARLVLVGDNQIRPALDVLEYAASVGLRNRVQWLPWVSDEELDRLYRSASVFAFLSEYEGFAQTPLEAIARDAPVVLLDTEVAREIYRDAAAFVPPSTDAIGAALASLLGDERRRAEAVAKGRELLKTYSWDRAASDTLRIIERAAEHR